MMVYQDHKARILILIHKMTIRLPKEIWLEIVEHLNDPADKFALRSALGRPFLKVRPVEFKTRNDRGYYNCERDVNVLKNLTTFFIPIPFLTFFKPSTLIVLNNRWYHPKWSVYTALQEMHIVHNDCTYVDKGRVVMSDAESWKGKLHRLWWWSKFLDKRKVANFLMLNVLQSNITFSMLVGVVIGKIIPKRSFRILVPISLCLGFTLNMSHRRVFPEQSMREEKFIMFLLSNIQRLWYK